ncbi:MAG: hypothetical protein J7L07_06395 [Candidatus Odinarchaeota archaeon]|nr:hypothetical protein [Candidatus Odinarchaeota archaeon]
MIPRKRIGIFIIVLFIMFVLFAQSLTPVHASTTDTEMIKVTNSVMYVGTTGNDFIHLSIKTYMSLLDKNILKIYIAPW